VLEPADHAARLGARIEMDERAVGWQFMRRPAQ
jgi:hypothetical protein